MRGSGLYEESNCLLNVANLSRTDSVTSQKTLILILQAFEIKTFQRIYNITARNEMNEQVKGKGHPCTCTEVLYRPYCP